MYFLFGLVVWGFCYCIPNYQLLFLIIIACLVQQLYVFPTLLLSFMKGVHELCNMVSLFIFVIFLVFFGCTSILSCVLFYRCDVTLHTLWNGISHKTEAAALSLIPCHSLRTKKGLSTFTVNISHLAIKDQRNNDKIKLGR